MKIRKEIKHVLVELRQKTQNSFKNSNNNTNRTKSEYKLQQKHTLHLENSEIL